MPSANDRIVRDVLVRLAQLLADERFVVGESGVKTVELLGETLVLEPTHGELDVGVRRTNVEYVEKELRWYLSQSLSIRGYVDDVKIWSQVCDKDGVVNSNYGWCILSEENSQIGRAHV